MKGRAVVISKRKRARPHHKGPAILKPLPGAKQAAAPPTSATAVVGERELQLARALSDTDADARDAALGALHAWLDEHARRVVAADWDKLCKALFYCVWMADTRPVITQVVQRVVALHQAGAWPYLGALMRAVVREWHGIDRHRVDKYYELVSEVVRAAVSRALNVGDADTGEVCPGVEDMLLVFEGEVFARAGSGGAGVALHVLDYWLENVVVLVLQEARKGASANVPVVMFERVMAPVLDVLGPKRGSLLALSRRALERAVLPLPSLLASEQLALSGKAQRDMLRRVMKRIWAAAASWETIDDCRKGLYSAHALLKERAQELEDIQGVLPPNAEKKQKKKGRKGKEKSDSAGPPVADATVQS